MLLYPASIRLWGNVGPLGANRAQALHFSKTLRAQSTCLVFPPFKVNGVGRHLVVEHQPDVDLECEGVILRKAGQAVIISTRDCPVVVIADKKNGVVGAVHAGRDSLIKYDSDCESCAGGVLERTLSALNMPNSEDVHVFITGGISAKHFTHKDEALIQKFVRRFGTEVVRDRTSLALDLTRAIRTVLREYGIKGDQITTDGLCTFDTPWLGSRRAELNGVPNKQNSNWIWVGNMIQ